MINLRHLALAAAAVAMLASCAKELGTAETVPAYRTKTVTLKATAGVKTTLSSERDALDWVAGDSFNVFANVPGSIENPVFNGETQDETLSLEVPEDAKELYAVYPAKSGNTKIEAKITIPAVQTQASAGVLNGKNCPMVGSGVIGDDNTVSMGFGPAAGILAINVYSRDNSIEKNVTKVVVTPYSEDGVPATGFCGTATVDLTDVSPAFNGTAESVTVTLTEPYKVGYFETGTAADHSGEIYVCLAPQNYYSFKVEVYTDDDYIYSAVLPTSDGFDFTTYDLTSVSFNIANGSIAGIDMNDYYSMWQNNIDFEICGQVINKTNYPVARVHILSNSSDDDNPVLAADFDDQENGGIIFLDNKAAENNYRAVAKTDFTIGRGKILIGRYKTYPQPELRISQASQTTKTRQIILNGKSMFLNIRFQNKGAAAEYSLFKTPSSADITDSEFYFQDCTLESDKEGIYRQKNATGYNPPKAISFDNCIIRIAGELITSAKAGGASTDKSSVFAKMSALKEISLVNCVVAPYGNSVDRLEKNGVIVGLAHSNPTYKNDDLNIKVSYCSFYDLGPVDAGRGMIEVPTCGKIELDHNAFYHSRTDYGVYDSGPNADKSKTFYTAYALQACTSKPGGILATAIYSNTPTHAGGNKTNLSGSDCYTDEFGPEKRTWKIGVSIYNSAFGTIDAKNNYFPVKVITSSGEKTGGASYDTKYWVKVPAAN